MRWSQKIPEDPALDWGYTLEEKRKREGIARRKREEAKRKREAKEKKSD